MRVFNNLDLHISASFLCLYVAQRSFSRANESILSLWLLVKYLILRHWGKHLHSNQLWKKEGLLAWNRSCRLTACAVWWAPCAEPRNGIKKYLVVLLVLVAVIVAHVCVCVCAAFWSGIQCFILCVNSSGCSCAWTLNYVDLQACISLCFISSLCTHIWSHNC